MPPSDAGNAVYIQTYTGTNIRIKNAQPSHTVVFLALSLSVTFFSLVLAQIFVGPEQQVLCYSHISCSKFMKSANITELYNVVIPSI